jgi:4'-phosphopantetheinyl transferase
MKVYIEPYQDILTTVSEEDIHQIISDHDKAKAGRYLRKIDSDRFNAARILLYNDLKNRFESTTIPICFKYNEYGKPHLEIDGYHFNWSHSGDMIALLVNDFVCGIDVEEHSEVPNFDYESICSEAELTWIKSTSNTINQEYEKFYSLWTAKESVLKAIGTGLSIDPREIVINKIDSKTFIGIVQGMAQISGYCKQIRFGGKNYSISWCSIS